VRIAIKLRTCIRIGGQLADPLSQLMTHRLSLLIADDIRLQPD
jgi:hypothetical protein